MPSVIYYGEHDEDKGTFPDCAQCTLFQKYQHGFSLKWFQKSLYPQSAPQQHPWLGEERKPSILLANFPFV